MLTKKEIIQEGEELIDELDQKDDLTKREELIFNAVVDYYKDVFSDLSDVERQDILEDGVNIEKERKELIQS